jgi:hypothetical protein
MQRPTMEIALGVYVACWLREDTLALGTPCRSPAAGRQASDNKYHHLWASSIIIFVCEGYRQVKFRSEIVIHPIRDDSCCCLSRLSMRLDIGNTQALRRCLREPLLKS